MEFTFLGYIILPLGILYFFYDSKKLYELTVFSIPFTGSGLFSISSDIIDIEVIKIDLVLGFLCLLRYLISSLYHGKIQIIRTVRTPLILLFILGLICTLSLLMPILIEGNLVILNLYALDSSYTHSTPLYFNLQLVTQLLYFLFGCSLAYYFTVKNNTYDKLERSIQIYLWASLFICFWGYLELILFYMEIPYPSFLFNHLYVGRGTSVLYGVPRITSATSEPSVLSQQLMTVLPLYFFIEKRKTFLNGLNLKIALVFTLGILLLSTSTTGIVGVLLFFMLLFFDKLKKGINIYLLIVLCIVLGIVGFLGTQIVLEKLTITYSGMVRLKTVISGLNYFLQYPLFGIGWGSFPTYDLLTCFIVGSGILGLFCFLFLLYSIRLNFRKMRLKYGPSLTAKSVEYSLIMLLLASQISGFLYYHQYFWFVLGLTIAASGLRPKNFENAEVNT